MKVGNISIRPCGSYNSENYGAHAMKVTIGSLTLWFSYETIVAFEEPGRALRTSENVWGNTTGKHLNHIDGGNKKARLSREEFQRQLADLLTRHGLAPEGS